MKKNRLYMNPAVSVISLILFEAYLVFFGPAVCRLAVPAQVPPVRAGAFSPVPKSFFFR